MMKPTIATLAALLLAPAALAYCPAQDPNDLFPYPSIRYTNWADLPVAALRSARELEYDEPTWNYPGSLEIELLSYETIGKQGFLGVAGGVKQRYVQPWSMTMK